MIITALEYTCFDLEGNKIAIEHERTIKSRKSYQEIIGQYMDIKECSITKKVIYYTEPEFTSKLQHLFESIEFAYRHGKTERVLAEHLRYFSYY